MISWRTVKDVIDVLLAIPGFTALGEITKQRTVKRFTENHRRDVMNTIRLVAAPPPDGGGDPHRSGILRDRLHRAQTTHEPDFENNVIVALGDILPRDNDGKVIQAEAIQVYQWIADLSEDDWTIFVEAMKHDPIAQMVRYYVAEKGLLGLTRIIGFLFAVLKYGGEEFQEFAEGRIRTLLDGITINTVTLHARLQVTKIRLQRQIADENTQTPWRVNPLRRMREIWRDIWA